MSSRTFKSHIIFTFFISYINPEQRQKNCHITEISIVFHLENIPESVGNQSKMLKQLKKAISGEDFQKKLLASLNSTPADPVTWGSSNLPGATLNAHWNLNGKILTLSIPEDVE